MYNVQRGKGNEAISGKCAGSSGKQLLFGVFRGFINEIDKQFKQN